MATSEAPDPRLLAAALSDRDRRPWRYYRLAYDDLRDGLDALLERAERAEAHQRDAFMAGIDAADTVHATADWTRARDAAFDRYLKEHPHG